MKILWFAWKDIKNPLAGGAEVVSHELGKRLVSAGHEVIFVVAGFDGALSEEIIDGYRVVRVGARWSVYFRAYQYYKLYLQGWADCVIDEVNTVPFFAKFYVREKNFILVHQLCRKIWFYQMFFPLNVIGYLLEPLYLWLLRDREVITVSESTKRELVSFGFSDKKIHIISEGIEILPLEDLESVEKFELPMMLAFGSIRPMKRTLDIVKAFELVKKELPMVQLILAGDASGRYGEKVLQYIRESEYQSSVIIFGKVLQEKKIELMSRAHILCVSSVKEGWGLVVSEANSQGTPAVVYDVDGLRDSVRHGETGTVCPESPKFLANAVLELLKEHGKYERIRKNAYEWSKMITFEQSFKDFLKVITKL
jgi:glycosyltransferase involved in cell wall biosynthesis